MAATVESLVNAVAKHVPPSSVFDGMVFVSDVELALIAEVAILDAVKSSPTALYDHNKGGYWLAKHHADIVKGYLPKPLKLHKPPSRMAARIAAGLKGSVVAHKLAARAAAGTLAKALKMPMVDVVGKPFVTPMTMAVKVDAAKAMADLKKAKAAVEKAGGVDFGHGDSLSAQYGVMASDGAPGKVVAVHKVDQGIYTTIKTPGGGTTMLNGKGGPTVLTLTPGETAVVESPLAKGKGATITVPWPKEPVVMTKTDSYKLPQLGGKTMTLAPGEAITVNHGGGLPFTVKAAGKPQAEEYPFVLHDIHVPGIHMNLPPFATLPSLVYTMVNEKPVSRVFVDNTLGGAPSLNVEWDVADGNTTATVKATVMHEKDGTPKWWSVEVNTKWTKF